MEALEFLSESLELLDDALSEHVPPIPEDAAWHVSRVG
jgi:hypothetical protein